MKLRSASVLCVVAIMLTACNDDAKPGLRSVPTQPSVVTPVVRPAPPPPPSRDPAVTDVRLGEAIETDIRDWDLSCPFSEESKRKIGFGGVSVPCRQFVVTARAGGTLVAEVKWQEALTGMWLLLKIDEVEFAPTFSPDWPPPWTSLIGRSKVSASQSYRISVGGVGYDFFGGPFVLTTRME